MSVAVLCPGQGSQFVGMGAELFESRPDLLGERADEVLGWSLRQICLEGPEDSLTRTEHAQAALFAVSYALWEEFRVTYQGPIAGAAGHSLGEYTALCAAGSLSFEDALRVVARRGTAMARAADLEPSGMAALLGGDADMAAQMAAKRRDEGGHLEVANINAPGQVVVAGSAEDIDWVSEHARAFGVRRVIPLKVAGAFHSGLMEPAADEVAEALSTVSFSDPQFPVWSNTTAQPHHADRLADTLRSQVVSTVRFEESLVNMAAAGVDTFVHVGPGDVTAGMAKRTVDEATIHVVSEVADIPAVADSLVTVT
jgi:[acyl-carrier-protein] S-malonyltransferase